jgi:hypothetical protein
VAFLAKQIMGILSSQIEIKWVFSLVGVLITLRCSHLQLENMDRIIIVVKNWFDDLCVNCKPHLNFKQYLKTKKSLAKDNYNLMEEHNLFEKLEVDGD